MDSAGASLFLRIGGQYASLYAIREKGWVNHLHLQACVPVFVIIFERKSQYSMAEVWL
jgi:hypothetical protein